MSFASVVICFILITFEPTKTTQHIPTESEQEL